MANYQLIYILAPDPVITKRARLAGADFVRVKLAFSNDGDLEYFRDELGDEFDNAWIGDGMPAIIVETEASTLDSAIQASYPDAEALVDSMSILESVQTSDLDASPERAPAFLTHVMVKVDDQADVEIARYHVGGIMRVKVPEQVRDTEAMNDKSLLPLLERLWGFLTDPELRSTHAAKRMRRFFRWYSSSRTARSLVEKFVAAWLSLECLAGCEEDRGKKGAAIKSRLRTLTSSHAPGQEWRSYIDSLWKLRNEILHEAAVTGFGDDPEEASTIASEIIACRYLALLCAEFLVHRTRPGDTLFETWNELHGYGPCIVLKYEQMPAFLSMPVYLQRYDG